MGEEGQLLSRVQRSLRTIQIQSSRQLLGLCPPASRQVCRTGEIHGQIYLLRLPETNSGENYRRRKEGGEAESGDARQQFLQDSGDGQLQQERPESDADQLCQPVLINYG